jgi:hypothetical protein
MFEIWNFKRATIIKLNAAVTNLIVQGIIMSHYRRDMSMENIPLNWSNMKSVCMDSIYLRPTSSNPYLIAVSKLLKIFMCDS